MQIKILPYGLSFVGQATPEQIEMVNQELQAMINNIKNGGNGKEGIS